MDRESSSHSQDEVVLVDELGQPTGAAPRRTVHDPATPLHLAFSCYLVRDDGQVLLTRRSLSKTAWPGVWTNSFCGHPRPGEPVPEAVIRYAPLELGVAVAPPACVLPHFRYRAVDPSGVVENEICPVFVATTDDEPVPNPDEVIDMRWVPADDMRTIVRLSPFVVSPWMALQVPLLPSLRHASGSAPQGPTR